MAPLVFVLIFIAALALVALRAEKRFRPLASLPMQWGLSGQVNWSAPRRIALAFIPVLGILVFASLLLADNSRDMRAGRADTGLVPIVATGILLLAIQQLHLSLAGRTLRR